MNYITDPRFTNYLIIALFFICSLRWVFAGDSWQSLYWAAAGVLNIAITGMSKS